MFHRPQLPTQRRELRGQIAMSRFIPFGLLDETNQERDPVLQQAHGACYSRLQLGIPPGHEIERQSDTLRRKVASGTCFSALAGISRCLASSGF